MGNIENSSGVVEQLIAGDNSSKNFQFLKVAKEAHDEAHFAYDAANYTSQRAEKFFQGILKKPYNHVYSGFDNNFKDVIKYNLDASKKNLDMAHELLNLANQSSGIKDSAHEFLKIESVNIFAEHYHAEDQNKFELAPNPIIKKDEKLSWGDKFFSFFI